MEAISWETIRKINQFHNQGMANIVWAYATLAQPNKHLMHAISSALIASVTDFDPQNLSNTLWAVARFG